MPAASHLLRLSSRSSLPCITLAVILLAGCSDDHEPTVPVVPIGELGIISAGDRSTCVTNSLGSPFCWGANDFGQLGDGTLERRLAPVAVTGGQTFGTIRAGNHTCAIAALTRAAYCWGQGTEGQLGNGATASSSAPVAVAGGLAWEEIDVGGSTCGSTGAEVYCWGPNGLGQLGTGNTSARSSPALVSGGLQLTRISVGPSTACGTENGTAILHCWGNGADGELGTGSFSITSAVPAEVSSSAQFVVIAVGGATGGPGTVCGTTIDDRNYCWGWNGSGQLGNGTLDRASVPTPLGGGLILGEIVVGQDHACGRTGAGVAYCWGAGGRLGDGTTVPSRVPVPVAGGLRFATLTAGAEHTCGRTEDPDNVMYCWGNNSVGQLGDGTTTARLSPVRVLGQS